MNFRKLNRQEILDALHLIWNVYAKETAPHRTAGQVDAFRSSIQYDKVIQGWSRGELFFLGWYEQEQMIGTVAITPLGKIIFWAMGGEEKYPGATGIMMENLKRYSTLEMRLSGLKIDAEQDKAAQYHQFGFRQTAKEFQVNETIIIPMECLVMAGPPVSTLGQEEKARTKMSNGMVVGIIVASVLGLIMVCSLIGFGVYKYGVSEKHSQNNYFDSDTWGETPDETDPYDEGYTYGEDMQETDPADDSGQGIEVINNYEAEGLSYTVEEASFNERSSNGKYQIDFLVKYPKLSGLSDEAAVAVNKVIEDMAMKTVNEVYLSPSDEMKEALLKENMPYLVSYVNYKITYISEDFMSLVLEDRYFKGDISQEYCDLRSVNINLKTGDVYKVKDIVNLSDDYIQDWKKGVREEDSTFTRFDELSNEDCKKVLEGDSLEGIYQDTFFVDADGIEIGTSFHPVGDSEEYGWVTVPYEMNEIEAYKTDSALWDLVK